MALFRPYEQGKTEPENQTSERRERGRRRGHGATAAPRPAPTSTTPEPVAEPKEQEARRQPQKKGTRTPTRAEAEAARMARLHPTLSPKEARRAQREASRRQQQEGLRAADLSPARVLLRNHIDAHWSLLEFMMPIFLVMIMVMLFFSAGNLTVQLWLNVVMMVVLALMVLNVWFMWRGFKRLAAERGIDTKQRGLFMYGLNRAMAFRAIRQPKPAVKRGEQY